MNAQQTKKQRIAQLLSTGIGADDVKLIVGVSTGYMARLKQDEEFKAYLTAYSAPDSEAAECVEGAAESSKEREEQRLADRYGALESKVVNQLIANVALADTKELTNLLSTISKQRQSMAPSPQVNIGVAGNAQITLSLPTNALGQDALQLSPTNEVVAVQGRSLVALDTQGAQELLEEARRHRAQPQQHQEVYHDL